MQKIAIIGSGIAGLTAAYRARQAGFAARGDWDGLQQLQDELTAGRDA